MIIANHYDMRRGGGRFGKKTFFPNLIFLIWSSIIFSWTSFIKFLLLLWSIVCLFIYTGWKMIKNLWLKKNELYTRYPLVYNWQLSGGSLKGTVVNRTHHYGGLLEITSTVPLRMGFHLLPLLGCTGTTCSTYSRPI